MKMKQPFDIGKIPRFKTEAIPKSVDLNEVQFSDRYNSFCVGMIDLVNSTGVSLFLSHSQMSKLYCIFINTMSCIIGDFGGKVVKNAGDSLLYYFPSTCDGVDQLAVRRCTECALSMIGERDYINKHLSQHHIQPIDYRISMDYGEVLLAATPTSTCEDIFGSTVNICAKINIVAQPNTVVIGGDLYELVRRYPYEFKSIGGYFSGMKFSYPVYSIRSKSGGNLLDVVRTHNLLQLGRYYDTSNVY